MPGFAIVQASTCAFAEEIAGRLALLRCPNGDTLRTQFLPVINVRVVSPCALLIAFSPSTPFLSLLYPSPIFILLFLLLLLLLLLTDQQRRVTNEPLLVFVNGKSGGCQGTTILSVARRLLNGTQVVDITADGPIPGCVLSTFFLCLVTTRS
jgi:hypothetical protein